MAKKLSLCFVIAGSLLLASCGGGSKKQDDTPQTPDNDLKKERIAGGVDSVRQRVYWAVERFGRIEKSRLQNLPQHDFLKVFDEHGFLIEEFFYNAQNVEVNSRKITYTETFLPRTERIYRSGKLADKIVYTYDDDGRLSRKETFDANDKLKEKVEYVFLSETEMDENIYRADGTLGVKNKHLYDRNGRLMEKQKWWGWNVLSEKETYAYDRSGKLMAIALERFRNAELNSRTLFEEFTEFGDYTSKLDFDKDDHQIGKTSYTYDGLGNLTKVIPHTRTVERVMVTAMALSMSEKGGLEEGDEEDYEDNTWGAAEEAWESDDANTDSYVEYALTEWRHGVGYTYDYQFDGLNNWVSKVTYKVEGPDKITRQFFYERVYSYR